MKMEHSEVHGELLDGQGNVSKDLHVKGVGVLMGA